MHFYRPFLIGLILTIGSFSFAVQQEQKPEEKKPASPSLSPSARLAAAKTAFLRKTGNGDNVAYDVVSTTLDGWGRFSLVKTPENADLLIEIYSVAESEGGVSASSEGGGRRHSAGGSRQSVTAQIRLTVYDSKTHAALWTGTEYPKGAMKKIDRENNEVEAAQRLVTKFHDAVEPEQKQQ